MVRDERILSPAEAEPVREGDYVYLLAPPERAQALDRFFVDMPPPARPDPLLLGDFFVTGDATLGALAEIYGLSIAPEETAMTLADFIASRTVRHPKAGDIVPLGAIALVVQQVTDGRVANVGLRLAEELEPETPPVTMVERFKRAIRRALRGALDGSQIGRSRTGCDPVASSAMNASTPNTAAIRSTVSTSRGAPSATSRPRSMITMRSAKRAASERSCPIASTAPPSCAARASSSITTS